ncbi:hypothetical protein LINPERHAP2_LOCUS23452 [Linum perenne]
MVFVHGQLESSTVIKRERERVTGCMAAAPKSYEEGSGVRCAENKNEVAACRRYQRLNFVAWNHGTGVKESGGGSEKGKRVEGRRIQWLGKETESRPTTLMEDRLEAAEPAFQECRDSRLWIGRRWPEDSR